MLLGLFLTAREKDAKQAQGLAQVDGVENLILNTWWSIDRLAAGF